MSSPDLLLADSSVRRSCPGARRQQGAVSVALLGAMVACVALLCVSVLAGVYLLSGDTAEAATTPAAAPEPDPTFVELKAFTVNLRGSGNPMLHVEIALQVANEAAAARLVKRKPLLQDRAVAVLSSTRADALAADDGKRELADRLQTAFIEVGGDKAATDIGNVLFTKFIVQ